MTKASDAERDEAIAKLRDWIKPGNTVYTVLDQVSRSGMSRQIRVVLQGPNERGECDTLHPNWAVGKALGLRHARRNGYEQDALVVGGAGMDMGFHVVNSLSYVLYPEYKCVGRRSAAPPPITSTAAPTAINIARASRTATATRCATAGYREEATK